MSGKLSCTQTGLVTFSRSTVQLAPCWKEIKNSEGMVRFVELVQLFLVEPDNLVSKDTYVVLYLSCIIRRFLGEKRAKQMKSRRSFVRIC